MTAAGKHEACQKEKSKHMQNNVIINAVAAVNKQNEDIAQGRAAVVVKRILELNVLLKQRNDSIADLTKYLAEVRESRITVEGIIGGPVPAEADQNANTKTVIKVVASMVEGAQERVKTRAADLASSIIVEQEKADKIKDEIADNRKQLSEIVPVVVTEEEIAGQ